MLDWASVKRQIDEMVAYRAGREDLYRQKVQVALGEVKRWEASWMELARKVEGARTSWLLGHPEGPLGGCYPAPGRSPEVTVLAVDGSQIYPSRHEVSSCYLINLGMVRFHYGTEERPLLSSRAQLYYREEDLAAYPQTLLSPAASQSRGASQAAFGLPLREVQGGGLKGSLNGEGVALRRGLMELGELLSLLEPPEVPGRPAVAFSDGTLIWWMLEGKPEELRAGVLQEVRSLWDQFEEKGLPVAGYISRPNSADVINSLRVGLCPDDLVNCDRCGYRQMETLPCSAIEGLVDGSLFGRFLAPGERSSLFRSSSRILKEYGHHGVAFFYLNAGAEVARVEVPAWVAADRGKLDLVHSVAWDQAQKGQGYPVCLLEAHERAVIRGPDRELFYRLVRDALVGGNMRAQASRKSLSKRRATI
ncbi:MAG: DNA double-strand break repair nuclease NurA [Nitrospinae bacterium]|nr:DNA double-strand break repair nuclease NurA [Nitrospinota bacterium]